MSDKVKQVGGQYAVQDSDHQPDKQQQQGDQQKTKQVNSDNKPFEYNNPRQVN